MKKYTLGSLLAVLLLSLTTQSCDTSSDYPTNDTSKDCAVTAVTLGTLLRTVNTKSATTGNDTTYTVNVNGALYPMYIDQVNNRIYNADSLPMHTNTDRVVFDTFTASGTVSIQSLTTGKDTLLVKTDSTDFRQMRLVKVYSADGSMQRTYQMEVNVHQEEADSFNWTCMAADAAQPVARLTDCRLVSEGQTLYLFGRQADGTTVRCTASTADGRFAAPTPSTTHDGSALAVRSIQRFGGAFWALAGEHLVSSVEGTGTWEAVNDNVALRSLVGCSADSLYALSTEGRFICSADGVNWTEQAMDDAASLPAAHTAAAYAPSHTDTDISTLLWAGHDANGAMSVWKHDIDRHGTAPHTFPWINLPQTEELHTYGCPQLSQPSLLPYDGGVVLIGMKADGTLSPIYHSADIGRTWKSGTFTLPTSLQQPTGVAATVDDAHHIWIVCEGTGEVWRGRLNRLAWADEGKVILKARRK